MMTGSLTAMNSFWSELVFVKIQWTEYCGVSVCLCVCVCNHISGTACPIFAILFVRVTHCCYLFVLWQCCYTLCTSGFMDDVIFAHVSMDSNKWLRKGIYSKWLNRGSRVWQLDKWRTGAESGSYLLLQICSVVIIVAHTHLFNGPLSGTTLVSRCQKGKTNLDFPEARDSEWQWNPLGHM